MCDFFDSTFGPNASPSLLASPDPVTLPISNSVGVSTPPTDNTEPSSTSDSSSPSSSCSITDSSSASPSDSSSSLPSSSENTLTSSSESSFSTPSTTTQPPFTRPHTDERSDPPMSQETSDSSGPTVTDKPPSSPSSSSSSTSTMSSSSSSNRTQESINTTDTSATSTSTSTSISTSPSGDGGGGIDMISTTSTTTSTPPSTIDSSTTSSTPPSTNDSSISTPTVGDSSSTSTSTGPSSADRPGDPTTGSPNPPTTTESSNPPTTTGSSNLPTTNSSVNPVTSVPMQNNGSPTAPPMMTLSEPVTFTTTDASGSTHLTVPPEFTTVIVTTLPGGTFTTFTEVVANPSGVLNDVNRDSVAAFFQNKGAAAGVFVAASLTICTIVLFVIFAIRRRRYRFQTERDAEIAAGLAAAISNQRFVDDEDHPVVFRNGQGRTALLDDDDDAYNTVTGPVMYSNPNGVGPPTQHMPVISEVPYPLTAARYTHAQTSSGSPSPQRDPMGLPITSFEQVSPTGNSGRSSHGGAGYVRRDSSSPVRTTSAPGSASHGTVANAPSVGHAPSLYGGHRPPASAGRDGSGNGTGSGSGGTSQPSLMTATPAQRGANSSRLEDMYPPQYERYSRPNSSSAVMGIAYEPDPVPHEHQIVTDLRAVRDPRDEMGSPLSADIAVSAASVYSRDGDEWDEEIAMSREDSRLDPVMRNTGGLASTASVGPRDEEDYSRRVMHQQLVSPSTGSNSHSMSHSHPTH